MLLPPPVGDLWPHLTRRSNPPERGEVAHIPMLQNCIFLLRKLLPDTHVQTFDRAQAQADIIPAPPAARVVFHIRSAWTVIVSGKRVE